MDRELRYFQRAELRAVEGEQPMITGYAVVYGQMSAPIFDFREVIEPGAFSDSVADGDVRALWQHGPGDVLGRTASGTLRLFDESLGVRFELDVPDTQVGRDAYESIRRRDVDGMSFGFKVLPNGMTWSEETDGTLVRRVTNGTLYEISPVTWPAYEATSVDARHDDIYGVIPEIPAELRARRAGENSTGGQMRAQAARRVRVLRLAEV